MQAKSVINYMRSEIAKRKLKGIAMNESEKRVDALEEMYNENCAMKKDLEELHQKYSESILMIGSLRSKLRDMLERYYVSEKMHDIGVEEMVKQLADRINENQSNLL